LKTTKLKEKVDDVIEPITISSNKSNRNHFKYRAFGTRDMQDEHLFELIERIRYGQLSIGVFGSGYVGLPTAALFAQAGFSVTAVDVKTSIVKSVNEGISPIREPGLDELVSLNVRCGRLEAELLSSVTLAGKNIFIITVQTPIGESNTPNLSFLMNAVEAIGVALKKNTIIAVCSTVPPGTLQEKVTPLLETLSGLKADSEFYLAYAPERIAPGKALKELVESPRIVGGIGPNSTKIAAELFRAVCKNIIETDAKTAEIAKTAENTFRDINIAFANQLALICEQHGVDITKVIELANTHPRVNIHAPGPGVGGPCLTKDPYLLIHKTHFKNQNIIKTARKINDYMPKHIVKLTLQALKRTNKNIKNSKIAIAGTAYKANVDDHRFSPSEPIIQQLTELNADITVYDPYCKTTFGAKTANSLHKALKNADCLIIITDHTEFKNLNLTKIKTLMNDKPAIIDGRRIINPHEAEKLGFTYYGVGYGKPRD
jgi:UDP-N-acetyl-D-mannosaminuronic acid dehydrogenase